MQLKLKKVSVLEVLTLIHQRDSGGSLAAVGGGSGGSGGSSRRFRRQFFSGSGNFLTVAAGSDSSQIAAVSAVTAMDSNFVSLIPKISKSAEIC
jgi:hypothetical protein